MPRLKEFWDLPLIHPGVFNEGYYYPEARSHGEPELLFHAVIQ